MNTPQTFGDTSKFAIQYRPSPHEKMAVCHLVIDTKLLGDPDEPCYLPTWLSSLTRTRNRIAEIAANPLPKEFEGLTDREIFETILKANQPEHAFEVDHKIWVRHLFSLDETIDQYLFYFYVKNKQLTFLIEDRTGNFFSYTIPIELFFKTVDEATKFLTEQYR